LSEAAVATSAVFRNVAAGARRRQFGELRNRAVARGMRLLSACSGLRRAGGFGILAYHRATQPPAGVPAPTWNVAPARFRAQMKGLLARGYRPWPLREALACHRAGREIAAKTFVVTFDDVYESVYLNVFPILQEYGIPATLFLATAYLDSPGPFPFDDWPWAGSPGVPCESWTPVTSAQCREMLATGLIELGTHSHSHADFRGRAGDFRDDLAISLDALRARFDIREATFAFPFGYGCRGEDGAELSEVASAAGVLCALTTDSELVQPGDDPFNWGRFGVLDTDCTASLADKLDGWYSRARSAWRCLRRRRPRVGRPVVGQAVTHVAIGQDARGGELIRCRR
jgi:peptidoglycan/xylan/chitin deacetylase (PgdA/CDA1 family)